MQERVFLTLRTSPTQFGYAAQSKRSAEHITQVISHMPLGLLLWTCAPQFVLPLGHGLSLTLGDVHRDVR
jgi:hypothetical protein